MEDELEALTKLSNGNIMSLSDSNPDLRVIILFNIK